MTVTSGGPNQRGHSLDEWVEVADAKIQEATDLRYALHVCMQERQKREERLALALAEIDRIVAARNAKYDFLEDRYEGVLEAIDEAEAMLLHSNPSPEQMPDGDDHDI